MKTNDTYIDLDGDPISLNTLDAEERRLVDRLRRRARTHPAWTDFDNYWTLELREFYDGRGVSPSQSIASVPWQIAEDLSARLGIAEGKVAPPGFLDELYEMTLFKYVSREAFCKATRIPRKVLDDFMAGRGDISVKTLVEGLERIGYRLRIMPMPPTIPVRRAAGRKKKRPKQSA